MTTDTPAAAPITAEHLEPCPFCGGTEVEIRENGRTWRGMGWGEPASVSMWHHCEATPGQPSRGIERVGRDRASAIAAWNRRARLSAPVAAQPADSAMERKAILDMLDEYIPENGDAWDAVTEIRALIAKRGEHDQQG